jgi:type IV pilus assembly protein PilB
MGWRGPAPEAIYRARDKGCAACARTGYRGRLAVAEILVINEELEGLIAHNRPSEEIARAAMRQGFVPMRADGLAKVATGATSLAELARVLGGAGL